MDDTLNTIIDLANGASILFDGRVVQAKTGKRYTSTEHKLYYVIYVRRTFFASSWERARSVYPCNSDNATS
jgi:hypothetical protein